MVLNALAALLGGATLLATAFEPRLLAEKAEGGGRKAEGRERVGAELPAATSEARPAQARP